MKKLSAFLILLLFLLLVWFSWNWYKASVLCCDETTVVEENVIPEPVKYGPLVFDCNSVEPITNELWKKTKTDILSAKGEGKKLLIVGPYFNGEEKSKGLSRAASIKQLFAQDLSADAFELDSREAGDCASTKTNYLHESQIKWVTRNENVVEQHNKTLIYFEYNATKEIDTKEVVAYLANLIEQLKTSDKSVTITGHTDADGNAEFNESLGLKRANRVKDYLMKNGISEDKITVLSKGKSEPVSSNNTQEGKQKNRRVEIEVN
jgi:outer membrane protein OmpA-like peptidoglycan-associated protein